MSCFASNILNDLWSSAVVVTSYEWRMYAFVMDTSKIKQKMYLYFFLFFRHTWYKTLSWSPRSTPPIYLFLYRATHRGHCTASCVPSFCRLLSSSIQIASSCAGREQPSSDHPLQPVRHQWWLKDEDAGVLYVFLISGSPVQGQILPWSTDQEFSRGLPPLPWAIHWCIEHWIQDQALHPVPTLEANYMEDEGIVLADSRNGYTHNWRLYTGEHTIMLGNGFLKVYACTCAVWYMDSEGHM